MKASRITLPLLFALAAAAPVCVAQEAGAPEEAPVFEERFPVWSPDGGRIAFVSDRGEPGVFHLYVANADGSELAALTSGSVTADWPEWSPDGEWIFFDSRKGSEIEISRIHYTGGEPVQVTQSEEGSDSHMAISAKGTAAFDSNREADGLRKLYTMALDGAGVRLVTLNPHSNSFPAWSPDGEWIAFRMRKSTFSPVSEIHVIKPDGTGLRAVTKLGVAATQPAWSPDGSRIVFAAVLDGNHEICVTSADGVSVERLTETLGHEMRPTFSADGSKILFCSNDGGIFGIYTMKADGSEVRKLEFHQGPRPSPPAEPVAQPEPVALEQPPPSTQPAGNP